MTRPVIGGTSRACTRPVQAKAKVKIETRKRTREHLFFFDSTVPFNLGVNLNLEFHFRRLGNRRFVRDGEVGLFFHVQ